MAQSNFLEVKLSNLETLGEREFSGHGSVFGNEDLGGDVVVRGAFRKSLEKHLRDGTTPIMCWQHDLARIVGKWKEVREDDKGLYVRGEFAPTPLGEEVRALLKMGAISGLSIGYRVVRSDVTREGVRRLLEIDLVECSVVTLPMNEEARVANVKRARLLERVRTIRDYEHWLTEEHAIARKAAKRFASKFWPDFRDAMGLDPATDISTIAEELDHAAAAQILESTATKIRRLTK